MKVIDINFKYWVFKKVQIIKDKSKKACVFFGSFISHIGSLNVNFQI